MNPYASDRADDSPSQPMTVSELNRRVRQSLERGFALLQVSGELSGVTRAASGHLYFTLKDEQAQVRCAMWRSKAQLLSFRPVNGMQVEARALVTLYEARGEFQLSIESLRQSGAGNIFEAFLRLKAKLQAEGLFSPALKSSLPPYPRRIAIITSPQAAALHDVLSALRRRAPGVQAVLYPALVQGEDAAKQLCSALAAVSQRAKQDMVDVVLLVRGGGSPEDLLAFNDESLARAIRACPIPVVSGVGHETDFSIADFAADLRAPTPTAAAELASAGFHAANTQLNQLHTQLQLQLQRQLQGFAQKLDNAELRLRHPRQQLQLETERCHQLDTRLKRASQSWFERKTQQLDKAAFQLHSLQPNLLNVRERIDRNAVSLAANAKRLMQAHKTQLDHLATQLDLLAPASVLARGYSITRDAKGKILRSSDQVLPGDLLSIELAEGRVAAKAMEKPDLKIPLNQP